MVAATDVISCYILYHRLNSVSVSTQDTPPTHSWSSSLPVICSLFPSGQFPYQSRSSSTLLYAKTPLPYLQHFTCQWTPLNTCILIQHLRVRSCTEQIPYVQFSLPYICLIIPHATSYYSTWYFQVFHMLIALHYPLCFRSSVYKHWVPVLYFPQFWISNLVHPSFLTLPQKSILSIWNQGHIGDRWQNTYIEA